MLTWIYIYKCWWEFEYCYSSMLYQCTATACIASSSPTCTCTVYCYSNHAYCSMTDTAKVHVRTVTTCIDTLARSFTTIRCCSSSAEAPIVPIEHCVLPLMHCPVYCMYRGVHCTLCILHPVPALPQSLWSWQDKLLPLQCKGCIPHCVFKCSYQSFNRECNLKSILVTL